MRLSPRSRSSRLVVAAAVAAVVVGSALPAAAVVKKPAPESASFKLGAALVKDNTSVELGGPLGTLFIGPQNNLAIRIVNERPPKKGISVSKTFDFYAQGIPDVRSATLPVTYTAGSGVGGTYSLATTSEQSGLTTTLRWVVDSQGVRPFTIKVLKYDSVTNRITGTFSGRLKSADDTGRDLKVTAGKFAVDLTVQGPMGPPKR